MSSEIDMARQCGSNITVDGSTLGPLGSAEYEEQVLTVLTSLLMFETGRAVINDIWSRPSRRLRIIPDCNLNHTAFTQAHTRRDARNATQAGEPQRNAFGVVGRHLPRGTGLGGNVDIHYMPMTHAMDIVAYDSPCPLPVYPGFDRHEGLLHELVHAARTLRGLLNRRRAPDKMDNWEEFFAVLVANVYASERGRPLRANHYRTTPLPAQNRDRWIRVPLYRQQIERMMRQQPDLSRRLSAIDTEFNPFRQIAPVQPAGHAGTANGR